MTITSVLGSALLVFCRMTTPSQKLGNNINSLSTVHVTTQDSLEAMEVDTMATNKRSKPIGEKNTQKKSKQDIAISLFRNPTQPEFWLGFQAMEQLAKEEGRAPISIDIPLTNLVAMGSLQEEARELQISYTSYPRVPQKLWPTSCADGIVGQHVNITQLSFDVEINQETRLTWDYHIILHFERSKTNFTQDQITKKVLLRLEKMKIKIGDDIGEPIAVFCHTNTKVWSCIVKLHLKNPEINVLALLHGTRPFVRELDGNKPVIAKFAKGFDIIAKSSFMSVKIDNANIKTSKSHHLLKTIVEESFTRGHEFEITKVTKKMGDDFAWIATTS